MRTVEGTLPRIGDKVVAKVFSSDKGMPFKYIAKRVEVISKDLGTNVQKRGDNIPQQETKAEQRPSGSHPGLTLPLPTKNGNLNLSGSGSRKDPCHVKVSPPCDSHRKRSSSKLKSSDSSCCHNNGIKDKGIRSRSRSRSPKRTHRSRSPSFGKRSNDQRYSRGTKMDRLGPSMKLLHNPKAEIEGRHQYPKNESGRQRLSAQEFDHSVSQKNLGHRQLDIKKVDITKGMEYLKCYLNEKKLTEIEEKRRRLQMEREALELEMNKSKSKPVVPIPRISKHHEAKLASFHNKNEGQEPVVPRKQLQLSAREKDILNRMWNIQPQAKVLGDANVEL